MPKVNIRELDLTGAETIEQLNYTVLVPGMSLYIASDDLESGEVPTSEDVILFQGLLTSVNDLDRDFYIPGDESGDPYQKVSADDLNKDIGFVSAYQFLSKGLSVQYVAAYTGTAVLDSSSEGIKPIFAGTDESEADKFFDTFSDKGKYDLRFITLGGLVALQPLKQDDTNDNIYGYVCNAAIKCAGNRGDAVALIDVPIKGNTSDTKLEPLDTSTKIDTWVKNKFGGDSGVAVTSINPAYRAGVSWSAKDIASETYGRYAAMFAPVCVIKINNTNMLLPASFLFVTSFARQIRNYPDWFATAGSIRGLLAYTDAFPTLQFGDADVDILQKRSADEGHIATNVICNIRPYGNIIWGNRTMHPLSKPETLADAAPQLQASSFLNIRELCITLKKALYRAARKFTFDPNTDRLWVKFLGQITPMLDDMKVNQGIRDYQVVRIPTKKKALVVARIRISPIEAVEDFDLTVSLEDSIEVNE